MKRFKSALLALAFALGLVAGFAYTPSAKAASNCWPADNCNICCQKPNGGIVCTLRACV